MKVASHSEEKIKHVFTDKNNLEGVCALEFYRWNAVEVGICGICLNLW